MNLIGIGERKMFREELESVGRDGSFKGLCQGLGSCSGVKRGHESSVSARSAVSLFGSHLSNP